MVATPCLRTHVGRECVSGTVATHGVPCIICVSHWNTSFLLFVWCHNRGHVSVRTYVPLLSRPELSPHAATMGVDALKARLGDGIITGFVVVSMQSLLRVCRCSVPEGRGSLVISPRRRRGCILVHAKPITRATFWHTRTENPDQLPDAQADTELRERGRSVVSDREGTAQR